MAQTHEMKDVEERVLLIGVSEQDGDDAEDSLVELADLVKTAGAVVVGTVIQKREKLHPGTYVGTGKVSEIAEIEEDIDFKVCSDTQWFFMSKYERMMYLIKLAYASNISCELDNGLVLNFKTMTIEECD